MTTALNLAPAALIEAFKADMRKSYLSSAARSLKNWCDAILALDAAAPVLPDARVRSQRLYDAARKAKIRFNRHWIMVTLPKEGYYIGAPSELWNRDLAIAKAGALEVSELNVTQDADRTVDDAVAFFNKRVGEKVTGDAITANLYYEGGVIQGTVTSSEGAWSIKLITNYRYGENAKDGHMTAYYQVPCRKVKG